MSINTPAETATASTCTASPLDWPRALAMLAGRILVVAALIPNGLRKIATFDVTAAMMGGAPARLIDGRLFPSQVPLFYFPTPGLFLGVSILFDIVGALMILAGWRARSVAAVMAGYCVVAMTIYHSAIVSPDDVRAILRNLPLVGGMLLLAGAGAGAWSVDGWLKRGDVPG